jgi:hypothetical protein
MGTYLSTGHASQRASGDSDESTMIQSASQVDKNVSGKSIGPQIKAFDEIA